MWLSTKILIALALCVSTYSFAEWRFIGDVGKDIFVNEEELNNITDTDVYLRIVGANREFGLQKEKKSPGIHLSACDKYFSNSVMMRIGNENIDIKLNMRRALGDEFNIYLNLFDVDGYLLNSIFMDRITGKFTGDLNKTIPTNTIKYMEIKHYKIETRVCN